MFYKKYTGKSQNIKTIVFLAAPVLFFYLVFFVELNKDNPAITYTLAVALLMALWWVTEVVPLAVTSLLPFVLFPMLGVMNGKEVASNYFNDIIFLFLGGFLFALAMQKWNLHRRIALKLLIVVGNSPARIMLGFMLATSFLSMWISNTATTMLMVPILMSIILKLEEVNDGNGIKSFSTGLLLAVAYSASIGGISTLVGTPPNLSFARIFVIYFPDAPEISFASWFFYAFPIVVILLTITFGYLYMVFIKNKSDAWTNIDTKDIESEYEGLGPWVIEQRIVAVLFGLLAILWFTRADLNFGFITIPGWSNMFQNPKFLNDGTVAITIAVLLFLIPSKNGNSPFIMDWKTAESIPWEIILLFGGGFALASGFKESGLSQWFGDQLIWLKDVHPFIIILSVSLLITFLTELTSNVATVETFLPVLAGLAMSIEINPLLFMLPATISASLAFMLPSATAPNAIIFGTKRLKVLDMSSSGLALNFLGIMIVTLATYYLATFIFSISLTEFPSWAGK
ncbi:SLC13 family permease [Lutimonas sp.]|jgi:sodium-dependent dicarboxylate transporter 2/3/5|uniref:SLC13 family permease n=1 Tax=Lutimonas sp. TaxID=1872403 RepID=UPI003C75A388